MSGDKIPTPNLDKMLEIKEKSQSVYEFLRFLEGKHNIVLAKFGGHTPQYLDRKGDPVQFDQTNQAHVAKVLNKEWIENPDYNSNELYLNLTPTDQLIAEFFEIDLHEVEKERRLLLKNISEQSST